MANKVLTEEPISNGLNIGEEANIINAELIFRIKISEYFDKVKISTDRGTKLYIALGVNKVSQLYNESEEYIIDSLAPMLDVILAISTTVVEVNKNFNQK